MDGPCECKEAGGGYNMYSSPTCVGEERVHINYSKKNLPHCSGPLDEYCRSCMHVHASVMAQVSQCGMPVLH